MYHPNQFQIDATFKGEDCFRTYAVRFVVEHFIVRPAGRLLVCKPPAVLFCVETGKKWVKYPILVAV